MRNLSLDHPMKQALLLVLTLGLAALFALAAVAFPPDFAVTAVALPTLKPIHIVEGRHPAPHPTGPGIVYDTREGLWLWTDHTQPAVKLVSAQEGFAHEASFSPDGQKLVYARHHPEREGLYILDVSANTERLLVSPQAPAIYMSPTWSPNGDTIAFTQLGPSDELAPSSSDAVKQSVWLIRADSSELMHLAPGAHPAWSPDSLKVAIERRKEIWIVDVGSGTARRLTAGREPSWSSDGRHLAFTDHRTIDDRPEALLNACRLILESSLTHSLVGYSDLKKHVESTWTQLAPGKVKVLRELYTIDLSSGRRHRLTTALQPLSTVATPLSRNASRTSRPSGGSPDYGLHADYDPSWSSQPKGIFFSSYLRSSNNFQVFFVPFTR